MADYVVVLVAAVPWAYHSQRKIDDDEYIFTETETTLIDKSSFQHQFIELGVAMRAKVYESKTWR